MEANTETIRHLAKSVLSCVLLSVCSLGSHTWVSSYESVTGAVRWASMVTLLSAMYYLQYQVWKHFWHRKRERRAVRRNQYRQTHVVGSADPSSNGLGVDSVEDIDLDPLPSPSGGEEVWIDGSSVVSNNVYYPELTMSSVWTYVYGWGVLLFVCTYCLAGLDTPSSCWWMMGMIALCFDELISKGMSRWLICLMMVSLSCSVFAMWSGALMDENGNFVGDLMFTTKGNIPLVTFVMGVVFPVSAPFIFFTIRTTLRSGNRDVSKLCEFALPFMTVLAVCCLVATSGMCSASDEKSVIHESHVKTRGLLETSTKNSTGVMVETVAKFAESYVTNLKGFNDSNPINSDTLLHTLVFISPFVTFWLLRVLIIAVVTGHSTEFITGFLLVTAARFGMTQVVGIWSVMALSGAGAAFILLLLTQRPRS